MKKGRFGILLVFYPILAFVGVILKMPLLCALLFVFVLFAEKDEWAGRQTLEALLTSLVVFFVTTLTSWFNAFSSLFFWSGFTSVLTTLVSTAVYIAAIVLSVLAIIRLGKQMDAQIPLFSALAYRAYGQEPPHALPPVYPQPPVPPQNYPTAPNQNQPYPPAGGPAPYVQPSQPTPQNGPSENPPRQ